MLLANFIFAALTFGSPHSYAAKTVRVEMFDPAVTVKSGVLLDSCTLAACIMMVAYDRDRKVAVAQHLVTTPTTKRCFEILNDDFFKKL